MIIFEGDYVRLTNGSQWLRVDEILFFDADEANNRLALSGGYTVPAPIWNYIDEVRSESEHMEVLASEVLAEEAL